jgi:hypothetical protein
MVNMIHCRHLINYLIELCLIRTTVSDSFEAHIYYGIAIIETNHLHKLVRVIINCCYNQGQRI